MNTGLTILFAIASVVSTWTDRPVQGLVFCSLATFIFGVGQIVKAIENGRR